MKTESEILILINKMPSHPVCEIKSYDTGTLYVMEPLSAASIPTTSLDWLDMWAELLYPR